MSIVNWLIKKVKRWALSRGIMAFTSLDAHWQSIVIDDLARDYPCDADQVLSSLEQALMISRSFRSVFLFRIRNSGNSKALNYFNQFRLVYPESPGIEITGEIEGGLRIVHNCCVISVSYAGKNLSVGPFVVIGKSHDAKPVIGNNVTICANSTVIGGIHIGDNALIGASSFVREDVASNTVVGGNPLKVLSFRQKP